MKRFLLGSLGAALGLGLLLTTPQNATAQRTAPPGDGYKKVSTLVQLPDFLPGLGTLYADPSTLPAGPFLADDRQGKLVSSIYMIPLKDMNAQKAFAGLKTGQGKQVDHVDVVLQRRASGRGRAALPHCPVVHLCRQGSGTLVALVTSVPAPDCA